MSRTIRGWRAREWRERLERYRQADLTVSMFCLREGVSEASFYLWRKKLGQTLRHRPEARSNEPVFAPIRLVASPGATTPLVTVQLPGGTRLEIPLSDSDAFERAIRILASADSQRTTPSLSEDASC